MRAFPIVATTWTLNDRPLFEALDLLHLLGAADVELWGEGGHVDPRREPPDPDELAAVLDRLGLAAYSIHAPFTGLDLTSPDADVRARAVSALSRTIELAGRLQCPRVVVHVDGTGDPSGRQSGGVAGARGEPGVATASSPERAGLSGRAVFLGRSEALERAAASLAVLCRHAAERGVTILVENQPDPAGRRFGARVADLIELIHMVGADNIGICFDVAHAVVSSGGWEAELRACLPYVRSVHASDTRGASDDHLPLGEGAVDWRRVLAVLEEGGFRGGFVLEVVGGERALERSLAYLAAEPEAEEAR